MTVALQVVERWSNDSRRFRPALRVPPGEPTGRFRTSSGVWNPLGSRLAVWPRPHGGSRERWWLGRSGCSVVFVGEVIEVHALELVGLDGADADAVVDHQPRKLVSVDEDDPGGCAIRVRPSLGGE